jgi:hypothetical protein
MRLDIFAIRMVVSGMVLLTCTHLLSLLAVTSTHGGPAHQIYEPQSTTYLWEFVTCATSSRPSSYSISLESLQRNFGDVRKDLLHTVSTGFALTNQPSGE